MLGKLKHVDNNIITIKNVDTDISTRCQNINCDDDDSVAEEAVRVHYRARGTCCASGKHFRRFMGHGLALHLITSLRTCLDHTHDTKILFELG